MQPPLESSPRHGGEIKVVNIHSHGGSQQVWPLVGFRSGVAAKSVMKQLWFQGTSLDFGVAGKGLGPL